MTDQDENSNSNSSPFSILSDIGKILAESLRKKPWLAAVILVVLFAVW